MGWFLLNSCMLTGKIINASVSFINAVVKSDDQGIPSLMEHNNLLTFSQKPSNDLIALTHTFTDILWECNAFTFRVKPSFCTLQS